MKMEILRKLKSTTINKEVQKDAVWVTLILVILIQLITTFYHFNFFQSEELLSATRNLAINKHQYYRLWTTLFVHADISHLGSNLLLLIPFTYFLVGHFGKFLFPIIGIFLGGLINYIVLLSMPLDIELIGISGLVYWAGATYITLSFFIDRRESLFKRFIKSFGVALILFFPSTITENVSYYSHFLGFIFGVSTGLIYYRINKSKFRKEEEFEYIIEGDEEIVEEIFSLTSDHSNQ